MNINGKIKLLPCPFCGGEAKEDTSYISADVLFYKCQNKKCGAIVSFNNEIANKMPHASIIFWNARKEVGNNEY